MSDDDQVDFHGDVEKVIDVPVEDLLEDPIEDIIPLLADSVDEYDKIDAEDLLEPDFMNPNGEEYSLY